LTIQSIRLFHHSVQRFTHLRNTDAPGGIMNKLARLVAIAAIPFAATAWLAHAQSNVELNFLTVWNEDGAKLFQGAITEYQKANPGVTIKMTTVAGTGAATYPNVLRTSIAGGKAPDLFFMWGGSLAAPFIDSDSALDLAPYYKQYNWNNLISAGAVSQIRRNGAVWGVPISLRAVSLYYRKDIFTKYKLKVPTTFAQLESVCGRLQTQKIPCVATAGTYGWHIMRMFDYFLEHTAGPELHDQLLINKTSWNRKEVVAAFALLKKWTDRGWFPNGYMGISPDQSSQLFLQGKAAMTIEGDWYVGSVQAAGLKGDTVGFFVPPSDKKPARMDGFAEQIMISKQSKNAEAAAAFLNWWVQPATQKKYYAVVGSTTTKGGLPSESANPLAIEYDDLISSNDTYTILDQAYSGETMSSTYFRLQSAVAAGQVTPADAAKQMAEGMK
jgi:raffinose/stachyose/melibiose transport system substrate-binding protein